MKALVLTAGYGTRLRPLTLESNKCLLDIGGKSSCKRVIDNLRNSGINDVVLNIHWMYTKVMETYGDSVIYFFEPELLGEQETEKRLRPWLGEKYIVCNGDTVTNLDIKEMSRLSVPNSTVYFWDRQKNIYAGTKIVWGNGKAKKYYYTTSGVYWIDIGTPSGLLKARKKWERQS